MGKRNWRFPDYLDTELNILEEVKSVRQLRYTLNMRKRPKIASAIKDMWRKGEIVIIQHPL